MKHMDLGKSFEFLLNFNKSLRLEIFEYPVLKISPLVISFSLIIALPVVDLPHPDSPTNPNVSLIDIKRYVLNGSYFITFTFIKILF